MDLLQLLLFLFVGHEFWGATFAYACGNGFRSQGYTIPDGDIILEYGEDLNITCVLNDGAVKTYGPNASSRMSFVVEQTPLPVEIINSTAIQLHIKKPNKTRYMDYHCLIGKENKTDLVCHNIVLVGIAPYEVTDFKCIGKNYQSITCTFTEPKTYINTNYSLYYIPSYSPDYDDRDIAYCPNLTESNGIYSCTWSVSVVPYYRPVHPNFTFFLNASNRFGNKSMRFSLNHYARVRPDPPIGLTAFAMSPHSIKVNWTINTYIQEFPIGWVHRVRYWIEEFKNWTTEKYYRSSRGQANFEYILENLPYAHCLYDIRVATKSPLATDDDMWSNDTSITIWTMSKVPDCPPNTTLGSYEMLDSQTKRIYWKKIKANQENGENFSYSVEVDGHPDIKPYKLHSSYAEFHNLSDRNYTFKIWSKNNVGVSKDYTTVFVPSQKYSLQQIKQLRKVDKADNEYDIDWMKTDNPNVVNYTFFWCSSTKQRPHPCDGQLDWTYVSIDKTNIHLNFEDNKTYHFAIAVNGMTSTSGMSWAQCTVISGSTFQLRETHFKEVGSRFVVLKWELECIKMDEIEAFEVKYCKKNSTAQNDCYPGEEKYQRFSNTDNNQLGTVNGLLNVTGLTPYTSYIFAVKPILKSGVTIQFGPTIHNSTTLDAPSEPQHLKLLATYDRNITIQWNKPLVLYGVFDSYKIYANGQMMLEVSVDLQNDTYRAVIPGLQPRTSYSISVKACTTTTLCSEALIQVTTDIGRPGNIVKSGANYVGPDNLLSVSWDKPDEPGVKVDYYEVEIANDDKQIFLTEETKEIPFNVKACNAGDLTDVRIRIRGVNIKNGLRLYGNWSKPENFPCRSELKKPAWIIPVIVISIFLIISLTTYLARWSYFKLQAMKINGIVKLPPPLDAVIQSEQRSGKSEPFTDQPLLQGSLPSAGRSPNGESSGCSSGSESVSSSGDSARQLSVSDSGTDQPKSPSLSEPLEKDVTIRRRPNVKKTDYVTMAEIPQTSWQPKPNQTGYSVIGLSSPPIKDEAEPHYFPLSENPGKSSYVQFPSTQSKDASKATKQPTTGYVLCPPQKPTAKNTGYVVAGEAMALNPIPKEETTGLVKGSQF